MSSTPTLRPDGRTETGAYFISQGELAAVLGVDRRTAGRIVESGAVRSIKPNGGRVLVSVASVLALIGGLPGADVAEVG